MCQGGTCIANPAVPNAPTNLRITGTTDIFSDLAFTDNSGNEDGFLVYANGGLFRTLGPNETIFQAGPPCGSTYQIFVAAQNAVGESAPTATVDVEGVCTTVHRIFISSVTFAPNLGSLANADSRCQMLATGQSLGGTWRAVLANSSTPVENRITVAGRVENLAGELVASDAVDFFDGVAQNAVDIDETGDAPADTIAWVGNSTNNCLNWTSTSTNDFGQQALATRLDGWLYGRSSGPCNLMRSLYCISQ